MTRISAVSLALVLLCAAVCAPAATAQTNEVKLWSGVNEGLGRLVYTLGLDSTAGGAATHRVYQSISIGRPQFIFSDEQFFNGVRRSEVLFTFSRDRRRIYWGSRTIGEVAYFFEQAGDHVRVYAGANNQGPVLYSFFNDGRIHQGAGPQGAIVFSTSPGLLNQTAPVLQAITILLEMTPTH
jgi:hypothetical protein